jgi:bifunctional DNA-binding transcriptional regulator/antitoxin component of YhaV-PrlF toxin-antitoxin module
MEPKEVLKLLDTQEKEFVKIIEKQQDEFLKRLEKIVVENNKTARTRTWCIMVIVVVYIICYFSTPYLTKNYNNIEGVNGNTNIVQEGGK